MERINKMNRKNEEKCMLTGRPHSITDTVWDTRARTYIYLAGAQELMATMRQSISELANKMFMFSGYILCRAHNRIQANGPIAKLT